MKLEEMRKNYEKWNIPFPTNGEEAESIMRWILDKQGLRNMLNAGKLYSLLTEQYSATREIAIHYKQDISQLPNKLNKDEKGNIGVIVLK
jgi:hypothetical protein